MTLNADLAAELQKLAPSAIIELFELDATSLGGDLLRFHAGTNQLRQNIVWQGNTYSRFPCEASGFEFTGQGQFPRPKFKVSNVLSAITLLLLENQDLLGAKVTRKRTMARFLDEVNFPGGVNLTADPTAEVSNDIFFIDRKSHEDRDTVEFELACAVDLVGVKLPKRQIIQGVCPWRYRSPECGYDGPPFFNENDERITTATTPEGINLLASYDAYVAALNTLSVKEAALSAAIQSRDSACTTRLLETQYHFAGGPSISPGDYIVYADFNTGALSAIWNGSPVTIGTTYRQGGFKTYSAIDGVFVILYDIQRWGTDSSVCTPATTSYTSALAARDAAQTAVNSALDDYNDAFDALPSDDPIYGFERCGKRLTSCKARFGESNELPFGGFPAAGLFK